jgi:[ribosomal protein S5]-alanine N-acetyltransferase
LTDSRSQRWSGYRAAPLDSARLHLEPITPAHAEALFPGLCDPALYRWLDAPAADLAGLRRRFERLAKPVRPDGQLWLNFAVRDRSEDQYVGYVQATVNADLRAHVAYFVFTPFQRRGYAREAVQCLLEHVFDACHSTSVQIEVDTRNEPSQRVAEALGFRRDPGAQAVINAGAPSLDYVYRLERPR